METVINIWTPTRLNMKDSLLCNIMPTENRLSFVVAGKIINVHRGKL
jgi:hypothetical protein